MSAFFKQNFITIPLKPILSGKPEDYIYKSQMSRVLQKKKNTHQPANSLSSCFTMPSTTQAKH